MIKLGYHIDTCEKYNPFSKRRNDLYGIFDAICFKSSERGVVGLQITSYSNVSSHLKKIKESEYTKDWLLAGNRIVVHGWHHKGKGARWKAREVEITLNDLIE